jgi:hypothetical protein
MKQIDLIPGLDDEQPAAAFCSAKMEEQGVDAMALTGALNAQLGGFASLLRDGCGVGVILKDGKASVIGLDLKGFLTPPQSVMFSFIETLLKGQEP